MLIENSVFCGHCHDVVTSRQKWQISTCSCGKTIVGGGLDNPVITGTDYLDMSWFLEDKIVAECLLAIGGATNKKEVLVAILSALRREGRVIAEGEPKIVAFRNDEVMIELDKDTYVTYRRIEDE